MESHSKAAIVGISLVLGLAVGGGVGYAVSNHMDNMDDNQSSSMSVSEGNPNSATKAADLRVGLNNLLREHVSSSLTVTRAIADGASQQDIDGAKAAQTANAVAIAEAIGGTFGMEAQEAITPMFVEHIQASNDFAAAVQSGDEAAKQAAQAELDEYLVEISEFFAGAISSLDTETVNGLLSEHESLLNRSVEAYNAGNFEQSYELEREAVAQVSTIADAIAQGTVADKPDQF